MIEAGGGLGYVLWVVLSLALGAVLLYKAKVEGNPTPFENEAIVRSLRHRESFLLDKTESKWGGE